jgi:hypothetical protein
MSHKGGWPADAPFTPNTRLRLTDGREGHFRHADGDQITVRLLDGSRIIVPIDTLTVVRRRAAREKAYREQRVREGLCEKCGRRRDGLSLRYCDACLAQRTAWQRARRGTRPWQPGKAGRPPYRVHRPVRKKGAA